MLPKGTTEMHVRNLILHSAVIFWATAAGTEVARRTKVQIHQDTGWKAVTESHSEVFRFSGSHWLAVEMTFLIFAAVAGKFQLIGLLKPAGRYIMVDDEHPGALEYSDTERKVLWTWGMFRCYFEQRTHSFLQVNFAQYCSLFEKSHGAVDKSGPMRQVILWRVLCLLDMALGARPVSGDMVISTWSIRCL